MNRILSFAALSLVLSSLGCGNADGKDAAGEGVASTSQAVTSHSVWNGGGASFSGGSDGGWTYLDVNETSGGGAWLSYSTSMADPTSWKCETVTYPPKGEFPAPPPHEWCRYTRFTNEYGWGRVPASAFSTNGSTARLEATLAAGPDFFIERCTYDWETWTPPTCTSTGGGAVSITWKKNNKSTHFSNGVNESRYGKYMWRSNGQFRSASADASGSMFGAAINAQWAHIANTHGVTVSKDILVVK